MDVLLLKDSAQPWQFSPRITIIALQTVVYQLGYSQYLFRIWFAGEILKEWKMQLLILSKIQ